MQGKDEANSSFQILLVASSKWKAAQEISDALRAPPDSGQVRPGVDLGCVCWIAAAHQQVQEQTAHEVCGTRMLCLLWDGNIWSCCLMKSWSLCPVLSERLEEQDHFSDPHISLFVSVSRTCPE